MFTVQEYRPRAGWVAISRPLPMDEAQQAMRFLSAARGAFRAYRLAAS